MNTPQQKALTYSQYYVTASLPHCFPYWVSLTFPGSPKLPQRAPLRHCKCQESQEDIWYLWYHKLGYCQRTTTCQKDFTEERQNCKRLAKGPLSNWVLILLPENALPPRVSKTLCNYKNWNSPNKTKKYLLARLECAFDNTPQPVSLIIGLHTSYYMVYTAYTIPHQELTIHTLRTRKQNCKAVRPESSNNKRILLPLFLNSWQNFKLEIPCKAHAEWSF